MEDFQNCRPLGDRVLIRRIEPDEKTAGGIIIPKTAGDRELAWQSEVIAVGPGKILDNGKFIPSEVKKGDRVLVAKYMGTKITVDRQDYYVVRGEDVLGVVEE